MHPRPGMADSVPPCTVTMAPGEADNRAPTHNRKKLRLSWLMFERTQVKLEASSTSCLEPRPGAGSGADGAAPERMRLATTSRSNHEQKTSSGRKPLPTTTMPRFIRGADRRFHLRPIPRRLSCIADGCDVSGTHTRGVAPPKRKRRARTGSACFCKSCSTVGGIVICEECHSDDKKHASAFLAVATLKKKGYSLMMMTTSTTRSSSNERREKKTRSGQQKSKRLLSPTRFKMTHDRRLHLRPIARRQYCTVDGCFAGGIYICKGAPPKRSRSRVTTGSACFCKSCSTVGGVAICESCHSDDQKHASAYLAVTKKEQIPPGRQQRKREAVEQKYPRGEVPCADGVGGGNSRSVGS